MTKGLTYPRETDEGRGKCMNKIMRTGESVSHTFKLKRHLKFNFTYTTSNRRNKLSCHSNKGHESLRWTRYNLNFWIYYYLKFLPVPRIFSGPSWGHNISTKISTPLAPGTYNTLKGFRCLSRSLSLSRFWTSIWLKTWFLKKKW